MKKLNKLSILLLCAAMHLSQGSQAQQDQHPVWVATAKQPATLGLDQGQASFLLEKLKIGIVNHSQTLASLKEKNDDSNFDYTVVELLNKRDRNKFFHFGDINLHLRPSSSSEWTKYSSAENRQQVNKIDTKGSALMSADITPTMNGAPIQIIRHWENDNGDLILRFELVNTTNQAYEIGSLGIPLPFNNNMDWKNLDKAHAENVFYDPYIGKDAGYLQVNHLHGNGASLLVLPEKNTGFEAYNPLLTDPTPKSITFEGFHEWMVHTKAYAETDWKGVEQWNVPTSTTLKPGETKTYGLRFVVAPSIKEIESELIAQERPVAIGAPGYLVPVNTPVKLFLKHPKKIAKIAVFPENALTVTPLKGTKDKWSTFQVKGNTWGKARLTISYKDGSEQTIHYKVTQSEKDVVNNLGQFLTTVQWYDDQTDPFHRAPSVISYDYETKKHITQWQNAWFAGLSDEAGAASWLAAMMKQVVQPNAQEIDKMKRFVSETMYGDIQKTEGKDKYGVVKSLFYYEPDSMPQGTYDANINFKTWAAWPKKEADDLGRSYNYPHVAAAHWVMYRLARNYNQLVKEDSWQTYLDRAFQTTMAMVKKAPYYAQFGQMEGSIFLLILQDLKREGLTEAATTMEAAMRKRADHWNKLKYPFGSEMPWDSTGQEEVYVWSKYFGLDEKAQVTLNAILAYDPTVPHWGYNGSARRYWDFVYGGKLSRIERQLHHYGSALNAIPVLSAYRDNPTDFHLLRVGHAGTLGALANVTEEGFGPGAFHSFPSTLANDGISGDYGCGFFGYATNAGTYIIKHPTFGWLAFSGNLSEKKGAIHVEVTTASRGKIFLAEESLYITLDAGEVKELHYNPKTKVVELTLDDSQSSFAPYTLINVNDDSGYALADIEKDELGRYKVPTAAKTIKLTKKI